jgi:hypothetical protein
LLRVGSAATGSESEDEEEEDEATEKPSSSGEEEKDGREYYDGAAAEPSDESGVNPVVQVQNSKLKQQSLRIYRVWRPTFNDCTVRNITMVRFYLCENPRMRCK